MSLESRITKFPKFPKFLKFLKFPNFSDKQSGEVVPLITTNLLSEGVRFGDLSQAEKAEFT